MTDHYCPAPFRHIELTPVEGYVPCCMWWGHTDSDNRFIDADHPDPLNHPKMQSIREHMLRNEPVDECTLCHRYEALGRMSERQAHLGWAPHRPTVVRLESIDLTLGNLCNMKCRMCWSGESSRWMSDEKHIGRTAQPFVRRGMSDLPFDFSNIKYLRIKGGEPSLEQDTIAEILDEISAKQGGLGNLHVNLITNGMRLLRPDLIARLESCGRLNINVSVDGVGAVNDYQRTGAKWDVLSANILTYAGIFGDAFTLHCTVSMLNVAGYLDLVDWTLNNLTFPNLITYLAYGPDWISCVNIPHDRKTQLINMLDGSSGYEHLPWFDESRRMIANMLRQEATMDPHDVLDKIDKLDSIRHTKFSDIDPLTDAALRAGIA